MGENGVQKQTQFDAKGSTFKSLRNGIFNKCLQGKGWSDYKMYLGSTYQETQITFPGGWSDKSKQ